MDPAEEIVELSGHQELPVWHHVLQLELGGGESKHLVADQSQAPVVVGMLLLKM